MSSVITKISSMITDQLMESHHIQIDEREIYMYGLEMIVVYLVNFTSTLILAMFMHQALEYLIFLFLLMPLRTNSGGYHASTPFRCYVLSTGITVGVLLFVRHISVLSHSGGLLFLLIFSIVILVLAPIGTQNKHLDPVEKTVYGFRARVILALEVCLSIICFVFLWFTIFWLVVLAIVTAALFLIVGFFVEKRNLA